MESGRVPLIAGGDLRPYLTFTIFETGGRPAAVVEGVLDEVSSVVATRAEAVLLARGIDTPAADLERTRDVSVTGLAYRVTTSASWAAPGSRWSQTQDHLVVFVRRGDLLGMYCTEHRVASTVRKQANDDPAFGLRPIAAEVLQAAFQQGDARVLWLGGAHPRRSIQPDSKVLVGSRLQDALDPLGDQSFYASASRGSVNDEETPDLVLPVGTTPRNGSVWYGPSHSWSEFLRLADQVLLAIEKARAEGGVENPFPILAVPTADIDQARDAYEVVAPDPQALSLVRDPDDEDINAAELLASALLEVVDTEGPRVQIAVGTRGARAGVLDLKPERRGSRVVLDVRIPSTPTDAADVTVVRDAIERVGLNIHYMSGHVITNDGVFRVQHRDQPFNGWDFRNFEGFDIATEKPGTGTHADVEATLGIQGDSLFAWVAANWSVGWLVCDDGPGEVADFLHLAPDDTLSLVHVKAALSSSANRGISAAAYELVAAQAQKSVHAFDLDRTLQELATGARADSSAVLLDGARVGSRAPMLDALRQRSPNAPLRLVIVQPHLRRTALDRARARRESGEVDAELARLRRLDTLLHATNATAVSMGATLAVIAEDT